MPDFVTPWPYHLATLALAYLLGSVPFGVVMAKLFGLGDLRRIGSGNIGATNVLRTGNRLAALLTLVGDAGKGAAAVFLARAAAGEDAAMLAAAGAFLGHCFPVFLRFHGGKGVATFLGTLIALAPPLGLAVGATWIATAVLMRISSLSALVAAISAPLWALWLRPEAVAICVVLALAILYRHKANIARLAAGTEPRIGRKS